jgi:hypothetical protein
MDDTRDEEKKEDIQKAHRSSNLREVGASSILSNEKERNSWTLEPTRPIAILPVLSDLSDYRDVLGRVILL